MTSLTIAVVGAGPAGLYLADEMISQTEREVRVDIYDRLPTPFGLLRYGVAPDHLKMKALAVPLQRTLDDDRVRFLGNVEIGRDVTIEDLRENYSAVVYTYGAASDRKLGVPGENLPGSASAAEFVRWYSGHPDASPEAAGDLAGVTSAAVIGAGNVALDVTRMLVKSTDELAATDVPDGVLEAVGKSAVKDVHVLVRRGPAQVKFTSKELREFGDLDGVDVIVNPKDLDLGADDVATVEADRALARSVALLREWSQRKQTRAQRRIHFHFWSAPAALTGQQAVDGILVGSTRGDDERALAAQLVVRCVGYLGSALEGLPFDPESGTIPNQEGRVLRDGEVSRGEYTAGWISRGPVGVLGTNRADATGVAERLIADQLEDSELWDAPKHLRARDVDVVVCEGWNAIDRSEIQAGQARGATRAKLATWKALLQSARN
jgi:ferredoxin--NADP+ reductase